LTQAQQHFQVNEPRGEFVVLLEGAARAAAPAGDIVKQGSQSQQDGIQGMDGGVDGMSALPSPLAMVAELIKAGRTLNDAVKEVAAACGCSRKKLYQQAIQARQQNAL
jgi:16S rRNA C1402 (ribose-2'-O) methylase RsmI